MGELSRYGDAVRAIKQAILQSQYEAAKGVNSQQLALYYSIGGYISANTRTGTWGTGAIEAISSQLQKELPGLRGFSATSLKYMRLFYEAWSGDGSSGLNSSLVSDEAMENVPVRNSSVASDDLPDRGLMEIRQLQVPNLDAGIRDDFLAIGFTHHREILSSAKDLDERIFYIHVCAQNHYSVSELKRAIARDDFHHQGKMPNNFMQTIPQGQRALRAIGAFKDEYLLDFINVEELGVRDGEDVDERVVEQGIVHDIKNFIIEFGRDFAFVGNQYHLDAFGVDQYIDLLFFNRELNCLVAVELKAGPFKTAYLGQLSGYLSVLDGYVKKPHENGSIGIVLCKDANKSFVDYVVRDFDKPMGVATYKTSQDMPKELRDALPPIEGLRALLEGGGE